MNNFCGRTRREFLWQSAGGFGGAALSAMLQHDAAASEAKSVAAGEIPAGGLPLPGGGTAKSVIFLFMYGGPSHIDTFDEKPSMVGMDGKTVAVKTHGRGGHKNNGRIVEPRWKFDTYGECGKRVSTLFPHVAKHVDDIAFLHSMTAESPIHGSAMLMMNSGRILSGSPSMGSWVNYGLGSVNEDLPGYVVMLDPKGGPISGAKNWSAGYMPATLGGTVFRPGQRPMLNLKPPADMTPDVQRQLLDSIRGANARHAADRGVDVDIEGASDLRSRIEGYELAFRMQSAAPEAVDLATETETTRQMYGLDQRETNDFGTRCLIARRLVERGVRFIQLYSGGAHNDNNWDAHGDLEVNHNRHAGRTDLPIAGLLADLKQRGLLDETLVVWGGEFGRQPTAEYAKGTGRDHNSAGFTMWMAGGGIKGGVSYGATDELGSVAVENPTHVRRLHATILKLLGLDPNGLSYFYGSLDQRLVGVTGADPISEIIA